MKGVLALTMLSTILVYCIFQPVLLYKYSLVEETLSITVNEALKQAAVKGRVDDEIQDYIKSTIKNVYRVSDSEISIVGTDYYVLRGNYIALSVSIPQPNKTVIEMFRFLNEPTIMNASKPIMSEYVP